MCPEYLGSLRQTLLQSTALGVSSHPCNHSGEPPAWGCRCHMDWPPVRLLQTQSSIIRPGWGGWMEGQAGRMCVPRPLPMAPPANCSSGHPSSFWQPITSHASFCLQLFFWGYLLSSTKQSVNNFHVKGKVKIISVNFFVIAVWKLGVGIQQYCWLFPGCAAWHFVVTKEPVCASPLPLSLFLQGFFK